MFSRLKNHLLCRLFGIDGGDASHGYLYNWDNCDPRTNGEYAFIRAYARSWEICFDLGANRGDYTKMLLKANPQLRIICFEPLEYLTTSLASDYRVQVYNCAIGSYTGVATLHVNHDDPTQSSLFRRTAETKPLEVAQRTLDEFCLENDIDHVDFCKIDTEGSELDVLRGAMSLIEKSSIRMIQFEYGGTYQDAGTSLKQIYELLSGRYMICHLLRCGLLPIAYSPEIETYRYSNWVALSRELYQRLIS